MLADLCLGYLAENPDQLAEFMGMTGARPTACAARSAGRQLQAGLIDYFAQNEPLLARTLRQCSASRPEAFMRVWAKLNPDGMKLAALQTRSAAIALDSGRRADATPAGCARCGSPRILAHSELFALSHRPCGLRRVLCLDRKARRPEPRR